MDMGMGLRIKGTTPETETGVVAGSIWENRMKSDEFKVFNGAAEEENSINDSQGNDDNKTTIEVQVVDSKKVDLKMSPKQNVIVGSTNGGKRRTWKSGSLEGSPIRIAKQRSVIVKNLDDKSKDFTVSDDGILQKTPIQNKKTRSQSIDVSSHKSAIHIKKAKSVPVKTLDESLDENANDSPQENGESCNGVDQRTEKDLVVISKEIGVFDDDEQIEVENKSLVVKEISNVAEQKANKNFQHSNQRKLTVPPIVKKQSPSFENNSKVHLTSPSKTNPSSNGSQRIPRGHSKLQSFVDLVMWRDVSRTAFIFGIGTFFLISSSFTKDLNISLISVISYLGLVYLAAIFLIRSFISSGSEMNDSTMEECVFGEEEAVKLVKLSLPYVNECLLNVKALFSGDPATTMKMAVMLYVLARYGSSLTIWKLAKLSFFGVFTVPKICSSCSTQLNEYGLFWIRRFREAWESCSHKKAVAFAIFTLVWNLSSSIARFWAVFMVFVAFRYYQQSMIEEEARCEYPAQPTQRHSTRPFLVDTPNQKRIY